jgi:hypothetical protein
VIGSLGLTHLLLPGFSVDEHAVASRRHQAVRATGGRKLDLRSLSFHGYTGTDTVEPDLRSLSFHGYTGTDTVEPG